MKGERPESDEYSEHHFRFKSSERQERSKSFAPRDKAASLQRRHPKRDRSDIGSSVAHQFNLAMQLERYATGEAVEDYEPVFNIADGVLLRNIGPSRNSLEEVID